jgi:hypothetical protein
VEKKKPAGAQSAPSGFLLTHNSFVIICNKIKEIPVQINLRMIFNTHGTVEDAQKLRHHIRECDLFIPEIANWHTAFRNAIYKLSRNELSLREFKEKYIKPEGWSDDTYYGLFYRTIQESAAEVFIIEPPRNARLMTAGSNLERRKELRRLFSEESKDIALAALRSFFSEESLSMRMREEYIVSKFKSRITQRIRRSKRLSSLYAVNVLMVIGLGHEALYEAIASQINGIAQKLVLDGQTHLSQHPGLRFGSELRRKGISEYYCPTDEELLLYLFPNDTTLTPSL